VLTAPVLATVAAAIRTKGSSIGAVTHAVNGVSDHVHIAVRLPATRAVAKYVEEVKGYASWLVNHSPTVEAQFYWQAGYGALTFRRSELSTVVAYVLKQEEHHHRHALWGEFERCEEGTDDAPEGQL
jgi:putative transposase